MARDNYGYPAALGSVTLHPSGTFLMHDVKTRDRILQSPRGSIMDRKSLGRISAYLSKQNFESSRNRVRTAPLWGVRLRPRLMHDGIR